MRLHTGELRNAGSRKSPSIPLSCSGWVLAPTSKLAQFDAVQVKHWACLFLIALSVSSQGDEMPPLTNKATGVHQQGRVLWHELFTDSPGRALRFYKGLFGWQSQKVSLGGEVLTMLWNQGRPIGAVIERDREELE